MGPAKKLVIKGLTYAVAPVGAGVGLRVAARLAALVAPILAAGGAGTAKEIGARAMSDLLRDPALADHLDFLCTTFAERTTVQRPAKNGEASFAVPLGGDAGCFDEHFAGEYDALLEWLAFALEVNMSSFFAVSPALRARLAAKFAGPVSSAPSPAETTG